MTIRIEEESVFTGQLKDLAGPYLGLSAAISLGVGAIGLSLMGWRQTSCKLSQSEGEVSAMKQQLLEKDAQIESLTFSPSKLEAAGLNAFLQADEAEDHASMPVAPAQTDNQPIASLVVALDSLVQMAQPIVEIPGTVETLETKAVIHPRMKLQAASALPGAQSFMGYVRPTVDLSAADAAAVPDLIQEPENSQQLEELLTYLKQVMAQIEKLHTSKADIKRPAEILKTELSAA